MHAERHAKDLARCAIATQGRRSLLIYGAFGMACSMLIAALLISGEVTDPPPHRPGLRCPSLPSDLRTTALVHAPIP
jgi:hypothetical protein